MKKPSSKIRDEIARLQEQLRAAETREAERIGRLALKAGLGEIVIEEAELVAALEALATRFRTGGGKHKWIATPPAPIPVGAPQSSDDEG